jgi:MerR family transcriptional regulator, light-induced transcriptional regulator
MTFTNPDKLGHNLAGAAGNEFPAVGRFLFSGYPDGALKQMIEQMVVPKLVGEELKGAALPFVPAFKLHVGDADIALVATHVVAHDIPTLLHAIARLAGDETGFSALLEGIFVPVARKLGEDWLADRRSFAEVSLGVACLQQVMHGLAMPVEPAPDLNAYRIALAAVPGDRHSFAASLLAEVFRSSGWHADVLNCTDVQELTAAVASEHYDVVGLSLARRELRARLAEAVALIRRRSRNPDISILVGGPALDAHPEWLALSGADGTAKSSAEAVAKATDLAKLAREGPFAT